MHLEIFLLDDCNQLDNRVRPCPRTRTWTRTADFFWPRTLTWTRTPNILETWTRMRTRLHVFTIQIVLFYRNWSAYEFTIVSNRSFGVNKIPFYSFDWNSLIYLHVEIFLKPRTRTYLFLKNRGHGYGADKAVLKARVHWYSVGSYW